MQKHNLILLKQALEKVQHDGSSPKGICTQIAEQIRDEMPLLDILIYNWLLQTFMKWPNHSWRASFPVPHPTLDAMTAFCQEPRWEGEYGDNRRQLLNFLKEQVELDLAKLGYMRPSRYAELQVGEGKLTQAEIDAGWFFDDEYDGLLAHRSWEGHGHGDT